MDIPKNWTFKSAEIAQGFDAHVREQLPWYDLLSDFVANLARHYMPEKGRVYDIGASTGNLACLLEDTITARGIEYLCIDNAKEMAGAFRAHHCQLEIADAVGYPYKPFDLGICFLVLMFLPVEKRLDYVKELYAKLRTGGALIIVDKLESQGGTVSQAFYRSLLGQKMKQGAKPEDVLRKEISLAGIQRPLSRTFFEPFNAYLVFRFGDFNAWVIEKPETKVFTHRND